MHGRSIFLFLRLSLNFELTLSPPRPRSEEISRKIRANAGVCRYKQLPLPGRQVQQFSLSCIWEILDAG